MQKYINGNTLELIVGDITKQSTDAIVNAANGSLLGGGGVDGAIHQAAGRELLEECKQVRQEQLDGEYLPTGQAVITKGHQLKTPYVIHTVGPIWNDSSNVTFQKKQLAACYRNSLKLAEEHQLTTVSFPSISTGIYRFPIDFAAETALDVIIEYLKDRSFGKIVITLFSDEDYNQYVKALKKIFNE